ncbi:MAG TPA: N-6 DNA methylase [Ktedonobacteraceae bacterium]|jgi:hypothetical protein|nr:N-6 DNA methylase [Ktedonobacteraceae bacterium]
MTSIRQQLSQIWSLLRKASVTSDLATIEYLAALLVEFKDQPWPFDEKQRPQKPRSRYNSDDEIVKGMLGNAARQINEQDEQAGIARLFDHCILFYSSKMRNPGSYPTPRHIVSFMMRILQIKPSHDFADFTCGSGGFLVERYQVEQNTKRPIPGLTIGTDIAPEWTRLAHANVFLHSLPGTPLNVSTVGNIHIHTGDTLRFYGSNGALWPDKFDRVAMSPPLAQLMEMLTLFPELPSALMSDTAFTFFLQQKLKNDGKGTILVSTEMCTRETYHTHFIREFLTEREQLQAVIQLNKSALLPFTREETCVLIINKQRRSLSWMLKVEKDGYIEERKRDLTEDPSTAPAHNDLPFIEKVANITGDETKGWKDDFKNTITYYFVGTLKNAFVGTIIKPREGIYIKQVTYKPSTKEYVLQLLETSGQHQFSTSIPLPQRPSTPDFERKTIFRGGKPGQLIAIAVDGRVVGVTARMEEISGNGYDLLPRSYLDRHVAGSRQAEGTLEHNSKENEPINAQQEAIARLMELPLLADQSDLPAVLGSQEFAIWCTINERFSTEQRYALPFTAEQLKKEDFSHDDVFSALHILTHLGLIIHAYHAADDAAQRTDYYRLVTTQDLVGHKWRAEEISKQ